MNPRPYTLRTLKVMADGKREHEYDVAINLAIWVNQSLFGSFKPGNANPVRKQFTERLIQEQADKTKGKEAFALLGVGLKLLVPPKQV